MKHDESYWIEFGYRSGKEIIGDTTIHKPHCGHTGAQPKNSRSPT